MQTGTAEFGRPTMGSWINYGLGTENQNLPGYVVLTAGRGSSGGATLCQSGFLPSTYEGVLFRSGGEPVLNLENPAGLPRVLQRRGLDTLASLNQMRHEKLHDPAIVSRIASYELAYRMQSSAPELADLSGETAATREAYGLERKPRLKGGRGGGADAWNDFARNCLLARRMVERGVRFVNIIHASWDHHSDLNNELSFNAGMADQPIAALIKDLRQRDLLKDTLIIWGGEFGRTPVAENGNGRDHNHHGFSMWLAGGGVKGGMTYGATDEFGFAAVENKVHVHDLHATILHLMGLDHEKLTFRYSGRDFRLTDVHGRVVHELFT